MPLPIHRFSREAMTTTFDAMIIYPDDRDYASQAAAAIFAEIDRFERLLNRHDPGTDVAQINRLKPGEWMVVNMEVLECLELAAGAFLHTGGIFDVCFRSTGGGKHPSAMNFLLLSRPDNPEPETPSDFLVGIDPAAAEHDYQGAEIDLGGIGKGYALDKAMQIFDDWGITNALLSSGGSSVLGRGDGPDGQGWLVGVSGGFRDDTGITSTTLKNQALSGSGTAVKGEHIRDPHSGGAAPAIATWAKASTAADSEVTSTALMILQKAEAKALLERSPGQSAVAVYPGNDVLVYGQW